MATQVESPVATPELIAERQRLGLDRYDEVWDGEYVMAPMANNEHQEIGFALAAFIKYKCGIDRQSRVSPGANVSDQREDWRKNYRCPDVVVVLPGGIAIDRIAYWQGGPDFVAEIVSPGDRSRRKFDFYAKVGVREVLIIDRAPWRLELFVFRDGRYVSAGASDLHSSNWIVSDVIAALEFRIVAGELRPEIEVRCSATGELDRI